MRKGRVQANATVTDEDLCVLAARLESAGRPGDPCQDQRTGENERQPRTAALAAAQQTHSHGRAYLGAGAVILGLCLLLVLHQLVG